MDLRARRPAVRRPHRRRRSTLLLARSHIASSKRIWPAGRASCRPTPTAATTGSPSRTGNPARSSRSAGSTRGLLLRPHPAQQGAGRHRGVARIDALFAIEREINGSSPTVRRRVRGPANQRADRGSPAGLPSARSELNIRPAAKTVANARGARFTSAAKMLAITVAGFSSSQVSGIGSPAIQVYGFCQPNR